MGYNVALLDLFFGVFVLVLVVLVVGILVFLWGFFGFFLCEMDWKPQFEVFSSQTVFYGDLLNHLRKLWQLMCICNESC